MIRVGKLYADWIDNKVYCVESFVKPTNKTVMIYDIQQPESIFALDCKYLYNITEEINENNASEVRETPHE